MPEGEPDWGTCHGIHEPEGGGNGVGVVERVGAMKPGVMLGDPEGREGDAP